MFRRRNLDELMVVANQKLAERDYWLKRLSGNPTAAHFHYDYMTPSEGNTADKNGEKYEELTFDFSGTLSERLIKMTNSGDFKLHMILVASMAALLYKYGSQQDIVVGSPIYRQEVEIEFINTILPLRSIMEENMTFRELLLQVRQTITEASQHQNYPLEILVDQLGLSSFDNFQNQFPLFDVMVLLENIHSKKYIQHININTIFSFSRQNGRIEGRVEYNPRRYERAKIERVIQHLKNLSMKLLFFVDSPLCEGDMLSEDERRQILCDFNHIGSEALPAAEPLRGLTVQEGFEDCVEKMADHMAVLFEDQNLTYRVLNERANRLAAVVRARGGRPNTIVGLMVEPSIEMAVGIWGILKAGGAYLPLEVDFPPNRITYMLEDSGSHLLLTTGELEARGDSVEERIYLGDREPFSGNVVHIENMNRPGDLAYIIYTSGTTGRPKGVMVEHRNVVEYLHAFFGEFKISSEDVVLQQASYAFDVFVEEFFPVLYSGGTVAIPSGYENMDVLLLQKFIIKRKVTIVDCTPLLLNELNKLDNLNGIHTYISGGDVLRGEYVDRLLQRGNVYNTYGPTETTVCACYHKCGHTVNSNVPIGKGILNYRVYILARDGQPVSIGIPGELCISGRGVSRGYLNNPQLTDEKFSESPYLAGEKLYKTGDLAKWLPDGNIEFLGRIDGQVKIRGYRVELGEIEGKLLSHENIKEAVVVERERENREKYLCTYIVSDREVDVLALRDFLSKDLAEYMIPSFFMQIDKLPLMVNGKLDRRALPELDVQVKTEYVAPRNDIEKILVDIWSEVLRVDKSIVGIDTNFFELGGHSLNAIVFIAKIHKELDVKLPLEEVFSIQTIRGLAEHIKKETKDKFISIAPVEKRDYYVLSSAQRRLYILQQLDLQSTGYHIPQVIGIEIEPEREKLTETFKKLIQIHESLRTSFTMWEKQPVQRIHEGVDFEMEYCDLIEGHEAVDAASPDPEISTLISRFVRPFDLSKAPLLRAGLIKSAEGRYVLVVDMHHIIADGISHRILVQDFKALYMAGESSALPQIRLQYKDYACWQQNPVTRQAIRLQEAYWLRQFAGEIPVLNLPFDYPRPAMQSFAGSTLLFQLDTGETGALNDIARSEKTTLFTLLLAILNVFLSKMSSQEDIVVGTPIAGRRHADLEKIIGMFVNTLALRGLPSGDKPFITFVRELRDNTLKAFENQDYQFEDLVERVEVERELSRNPLFDVMFILQNIFDPAETREVSEEEMRDAKIKSYGFEGKTAKFDLTFAAVERGDRLAISLNYCTSLFKEATIARFIRYFKEIVSSIVKHPEGKIAAIGMMNEEEKSRVLYEFNDTGVEYARDKVLAELFEEQVSRTPHHIAVTGACLKSTPYGTEQNGRRALTYRELDEQTDQLAGLLRASGVKPDTITAVMMNRSIEMMAALLSVVKAGGAYLPIDPGFPTERIEYILKHSSTPLILTTADLGSLIAVSSNCRILALDGENPFGGNGDRLEKVRLAGPDNLAYCIYTSGSTGRPKGVMIENRALVNFIKGITDIIGFGDRDSLLALTTISFDIFGLETLLPLTRGCKVVVGTGEDQVNGAAAASAMAAEGVTILQVTPSRLALLLSQEESAARLGTLKYLLVGGEALPVQLLEQARQVVGGKIYNMYGPTETTIWSTVKDVSVGEALNIGRPIANTGIYILGREDTLQPVGVVGELCISGDGLGRGYVNNAELTAKKFPLNPYARGGNLYRTGDVARWLADGNLEFLGRVDDQVKIRGFRIELAEIEGRLARHPGIKEAVVACKLARGRDRHICAYIVTAEGSGETVGSMELREYLSQRLPDYMIPSFFIHLEKIPLTPNGKIDRKALPLPELKAGENYTAPRDGVERKLVEIWSEELGVGKDIIGIDANFFELGGHSLKATIIAARIHKELNVKLPLAAIFKSPNIRGLGESIRGLAEDKYTSINPVEQREYYPLSSAQKRIFVLYQMDKTNTRYNMPTVLVMEFDVCRQKLAETFRKLIKRHEVLRTSFVMLENEPEPVQWVHRDVEFKIDYFEAPEAESAAIVKAFIRPFDLGSAPLLRVGLIKTGDRRFVWMMDIYHIISDGVSYDLLVNDFLRLYIGEALPPLKLQYKDFSEWQNRLFASGEIKKQAEYWLNRFEGEIPDLHLPTDFPDSSLQRLGEGGLVKFGLERGLVKGLYEMVGDTEATVYMILLTVFNILLSKYSGQEDIVVGTPVAGRNHLDLKNLIGMFANMVAMRNVPAEHKTFGHFLGEVKENAVNAFENQDYQFEELVRKLGIMEHTRNPLCNVVFVLQNFDYEAGNIGTGDLKIDRYPFENQTVKFDLQLEAIEGGDFINLNFNYPVALFKQSTVETMAGHFVEILDQVMENRNIKLRDIAISHDLITADTNVLQESNASFGF
jgi:amino acid adenylation domain-containing protein